MSGVVYTARDAAHKRIVDALERGGRMPFPLKGQVVYYAGPCPAAPGQVIGSLGPTTSARMDRYAPRLLSQGLAGMIGKGKRSPEVRAAVREYGGVYFVAIGGCGALLSQSVKAARLLAYEDLGPEAVYELAIEDFPAVVAIDPAGNDLYEEIGKEAGRQGCR